MKYMIIFLLLPYLTFGQFYQAPIDTVLAFAPGEGQSTGQGKEYFPANIFKLPDSSARVEVPASSPEQICSIGLSGEIIVGFKNFIITDGPGPDFIVFENAFINPVNKKVFAEPAVISVSLDGINFIEFPYDTVTLIGCAGITPVQGTNDRYNWPECGGDCFDLAVINMKKARFIKIRDISYIPKYNREHNYHDPIISGFDLDGIAGVNLEQNTSDISSAPEAFPLIIEQSNDEILIKSAENEPIRLCIQNMLGQLIYQEWVTYTTRINMAQLSNGIYLFHFQSKAYNYFRTMKLWH